MNGDLFLACFQLVSWSEKKSDYEVCIQHLKNSNITKWLVIPSICKYMYPWHSDESKIFFCAFLGDIFQRTKEEGTVLIGSLDVTKLLEFYVRLLYGGMMKISNVL